MSISIKVLKELLKVQDSKPTGTSTQIRMRCPVCNHHNNKLYVGMMYNSETLGYDCKHCSFSGGVGPKFLNMFNIEPELIKEYTSLFKYKNKKIMNPVVQLKKLNIVYPPNSNITELMKKYPGKINLLKKRLGRNITIDDIKKYKIVLDLKYMLDFNNIKYLDNIPENTNKKMVERYIKEYSEHFLGFFTYDYNKVNLRNIDSMGFTKRYINHVIDNTINNPFLYIPDVQLDLITTNPIIVMGEGPFDIIGVKERYFLNEDNNTIFAAVGTRGAYKRALYQILKMTGFINAKVLIYSDNDVTLDYYQNLFKEEMKFLNFTIFYNKLSKDFGDLSEPVQLEKYKL